MKSVRDSFAEALGALLALGMNPEAQVLPCPVQVPVCYVFPV